jgi:hypothetical protein
LDGGGRQRLVDLFSETSKPKGMLKYGHGAALGKGHQKMPGAS